MVVAAEQYHEPLEEEFSFWALNLLQALHLMPLKQWEIVTVRPFHVHHPTIRLTTMGFGKVGYSYFINKAYL